MAAPRWSAHAACIVALLAFTSPARAAGGGIGVSAEELTPQETETTAATITFHPYRSPATLFPHANRDLEFLWSDTYVSAFNKRLDAGGFGLNDLDLFSKTIAEEYANPFGFPMSDVQIVYDYLNFPHASRSATYNASTTAADTIGFMVLGSTTARPADRAHVDTYLYAPRFSHDPADDSYEPNTAYPSGCYDVTNYWAGCKNYGQWTSFFFSDSEDVSTGHSTSDVQHWNSQMIPGPVPSQIGDTSATRWSRQSGGQSGAWNHEFQHNFNAALPSYGTMTEIWSSAAEAIGGEAGGKIRYDVPYTFGLLESNYQAWRTFTAYLAYNLRGTDLSFAGRTDDLLWRWAHGNNQTFTGLASRLDSTECAECTTKAWLHAYPTGYDRLQAIIHNWRVANFVNNSSLAEGQYGYPAAFGFVPSRDVGNWQDIDHLNPSDDVVALPQDIPMGKSTVTRDTVIAGTRCRPGSATDCAPVALRAYGSDYWIAKADPSIRDANRTLKVRAQPLGRVAWPNCGFNGRMMVTVVSYNAPQDSLNVLWRNPSYVTAVYGPVALEVDSIRGSADLSISNFGTTNNAAVVILTLEEGPGGHLGLGGYTDGQPKLPYQLTVGFSPASVATAVQAAPDSVDRGPVWAPSGTQLAYIHQISGSSQRIYKQNLDGSGKAPLFVPSSDIRIYYCDWSPRGDWVVYDRSPNLYTPFDIWAYNVNTSEQRQLTSHSELDNYPSFSPNGQKVAYWWYKNNTTWEIHVVNIDGTGDYLVVAPGEGPWGPVRWSADGNSLLYVINGGTVYSVSSAGGGSQTAKPEYGDVYGLDPALGAGRPISELKSTAIVCNAASLTSQGKLSLRDLTNQRDDIRFLTNRSVKTPRWSFDGTKVAFGYASPDGSDQDVYYGTVTGNHAPVFTGGVTDLYWDACIQMNRTMYATDADGETITFQGINLPPGSTIVAGNKFRWTPTADQVGDWYVTFRAKDPSGGYANIVVKYTIGNANDYCNNNPCPPNLPNCLPERAQRVGDATEAPTVFALDQNEPNPFHGNTAIQFAVPRAEHVRIEIFDLLGRRVRTLADRSFEVGFHSLQWDQRDQNGNLAHPGVYMYRMQAGSFRSQKKMLLTP